MVNLLGQNLVWKQAPTLTLKDKIKGFFEPLVTLFTGLKPKEREEAKLGGIPSTKVRLPFAKEPTIIRPVEAPIISMPLGLAGRLIEIIPKAVVQTIQNYKEIKALGKAEPLKLPFDAKRLGFDTPEIESTGKRLVDKFNQLNETNPPQSDFDVWKNAGLSSLMVVVPDSFDAFIAGNMAELGAKITLKVTKYDPMLERSLSTLGIPKNKAFTGDELAGRVKESLLQSKTITDYSDTLKAGKYIFDKCTGKGITVLNPFFAKIQNTARDLILPLEQMGIGFQTRPIAPAGPGLPGYLEPKFGMAITPRVGGEGEIAKQVSALAKKGLTPEVIAKQPGVTEPVVKSILGEVAKGVIPPIKPPIPPTPPPAEMPEFKGEPVGDPIVKLNELLKQAKPLRGKLEKAYTAERAKRIAGVEAFIENTIDKVGGEEGYRMILSKLKGELVSPEAKIRFEPIKEKLTADELKSLFIRTWKHPYLDNWEKISAADGLTNLLQGGLPQPKQLTLLEEIYGSDLIKSILSKRVWGAKATDFLIELANLPRALRATADMSGFLRQAIIEVPAHPIISTKAMAKTFQFAFSPKSFREYFKDLPKDPLYSLIRKSKIAITDPSKAGMVEREEAFMSRFLQKIPIVKHPVEFAERAYVGFLNKLRVDLFKNWADELLSKGYSMTKDIDIFKAAANVTNTFTGRGSLGRLNRVAPDLNVLFFSIRLQAARFNALNPVWYANMWHNPRTRPIAKKAISDFAKFVATGLTTLAIIKLYKEATGASDEELSVETDLRSSDAGKIKISNTRWDIWGGFQQWARVFAQITTGERKNTSTGEIVSLNKDEYPFTTRKEVLLRFIEGKLSPVPALINELISGAKTFTGEDITAKDVINDMVIPMYIEDIADAYRDGSLGRAVGAGIPAFFGIGVQTWEERKRVLPPAGMPTGGSPKMPGIETPVFPKTTLPSMPGIFK